MELVEDYPLTNEEKKDIAGIYLNLSFHPDRVLLGYSHVLYNLVEEVTDEELIGEVVKGFNGVMRAFGEEVLGVGDYVGAIRPLILSHCLLEHVHPPTVRFLA